MLRRITAGLGRRVASGDIASLPSLWSQREYLDSTIRWTVAQLLAVHGYSWSDIARELGVSRQAARQRWGGKRSQL